MKIPKLGEYPEAIYFNGERYQLSFIEKFHAQGETDSGKKTIKLRAGMSLNDTFRAYIHELLHLMEMEAGIRLKHDTVYKLEDAIFTLLLDNFIKMD